MGRVVERIQKAWSKRDILGDAEGTIEFDIPISSTITALSENPYARTESEPVTVVYDHVFTGWYTDPQESPDGLRVNSKTGRCVIPLTGGMDFDELKETITGDGVACRMDNESVNITQVEHDTLGVAAVIYVERIE